MTIGRGISDCDGAPTTAAERRQKTQWVMADQFEYAILDERGTWRKKFSQDRRIKDCISD
jgi:hypothetical protein